MGPGAPALQAIGRGLSSGGADWRTSAAPHHTISRRAAARRSMVAGSRAMGNCQAMTKLLAFNGGVMAQAATSPSQRSLASTQARETRSSARR
jgi:hypothetical protein